MKKPSFRRLLALLLSAALAFSAAGCAGAPSGESVPDENQPGVSYTQLMDDMNRQVLSELSEAIPDVLWWGTAGGHVVAYGVDDSDPETPALHLLADIDPENETFTCVSLALPQPAADIPRLAEALAAGVPDAAERGNSYEVAERTVAGVLETSTKQLYLLLVDTLYLYEQDAAGYVDVSVSERAVTLCSLAENGDLQPAARMQIPEEYLLLPEMAENCLLGPDDTLWLSAADYFSGQSHLLRFSLQDGQLLSALSLPEGCVLQAGGLARLGMKDLLVLCAQQNPQTGGIQVGHDQLFVLKDTDTDTPAWQDPIPLTGVHTDSPRLLPDPSKKAIATAPLLYDRQGAYSVDLSSGEVSERASWVEYLLSGAQLAAVFSLQEGRYLAVTRSDDGASQLQVLTPLDPAVVAGRKVLRFGKTYYTSSFAGNDPIEAVIAKFNATSTEYYVEIVDYVEMDTVGGRMGTGTDFLTQDILDGTLPDIMMLTEGTLSLFMEKGAGVDLYPYIDADPVLSREDFLPHLLAAYETPDGRLPAVMAAYAVNTLAGDGALLGEAPGWTVQDYLQLCEAQGNPAPIGYVDRSRALLQFVLYGGDTFVDRQAHEAHFDTPEFVQLLEGSAAYPGEAAWDLRYEDPAPAVESGKMLLTPYNGFEARVQTWGDLVDPAAIYGQDFVLKGYPTRSGDGSSSVSPLLQLGISSQCPYPEGAWELLRMFLLPEFQDTLGVESTRPGFPLRQDSLALTAQKSRAPQWDWQSERVYLPIHLQNLGYTPTTEYFIALTDQDLEKLLAVLTSPQAVGVAQMDYTLNGIVLEEIDYFYNGVRSAEETAAIIQDRVQTYLAEQN